MQPDEGEQLAGLLLRTSWIHRRVESLRFEANGGTRLVASLDVTVPPQEAITRANRVIVPLAVIRKGALRKVDTRDFHGKPMPVLDAQDNGALTLAMLVSVGRSILPPHVGTAPRFEVHLRNIVLCTPEQGDHQAACFRGRLQAHRVEPDDEAVELFTSMVSQFSTHFLLAVEAPRDVLDGRTVLKYSYDDPLPSVQPRHLAMSVERPVGNYGMATSSHFEVVAPAGIGFQRLDLCETLPLSTVETVCSSDVADDARTPESVLHVSHRPSHRFSHAVIRATLAPPASGLVPVACWGAAFALILTLGCVIATAWPERLFTPNATPPPATSLLLAGPALLLSWLSRAPEHAMVAHVLRPARRILVFSALSIFCLALAVSLPFRHDWMDWTFLILATGIQTFTAFEAAKLAALVRRPPYDRQ